MLNIKLMSIANPNNNSICSTLSVEVDDVNDDTESYTVSDDTDDDNRDNCDDFSVMSVLFTRKKKRRLLLENLFFEDKSGGVLSELYSVITSITFKISKMFGSLNK